MSPLGQHILTPRPRGPSSTAVPNKHIWPFSEASLPSWETIQVVRCYPESPQKLVIVTAPLCREDNWGPERQHGCPESHVVGTLGGRKEFKTDPTVCIRVVLNSQRSACPCPDSAKIEGVYIHAHPHSSPPSTVSPSVSPSAVSVVVLTSF